MAKVLIFQNGVYCVEVSLSYAFLTWLNCLKCWIVSMNFMVIVKKIKFLWNQLSNVVEYIWGEKAVISTLLNLTLHYFYIFLCSRNITLQSLTLSLPEVTNM